MTLRVFLFLYLGAVLAFESSQPRLPSNHPSPGQVKRDYL